MLNVRAYSHVGHTGYGRMTRELCAALDRLGAGVVIDPDPVTENVLHVTVPPRVRYWWEGERLHIFTMYETTKAPVEFRNMAAFDTVFVPCPENHEAFAEWHDNVVMVPLGVDGERWRFRDRPTSGPFTILSSGSEYRKGHDVAIAAFQRAFPRNPDVRLILKRPTDLNWFRAPGDPRIQVVSGFLSDEDEVDLYASAHVYLGLARGEGFGMMPLQAIAQGCPTIISACSGHTMFATYASALVGCDLELAHQYTLFGEAGDWWEPRVDDAVEALRSVYQDYTGHQAAAWLASIEARERFTWDRTARQVLDHLDGELPLYRGNRVKVIRQEATFPIQVVKPVHADIGPHVIDFVPGIEYWHTADVKRVLHDAGYLVPGTYDDKRMRLPERTTR